MRKRRHRIADPLSGILADWFGIDGGSARMLSVMYAANFPLSPREIARQAHIAQGSIWTYAHRLRLAGLGIPNAKPYSPQYELAPEARAEVQRAYAHARNLLGTYSAEMEALKEENETLRGALGINWEGPNEWGLTHMERQFVGVLMRTKVAPRERLFLALYGNESNPPDDKIIDIWACKVRKKLRPFGLEVRNQWGVGYYLAERDAA